MEELCHEILSRLPVKSLLRFRCVSKAWLSLINDHDFRRLHLKNFKKNCDETHLLVVEGCFVVRCSAAFETNPEMLHTLGDGWQVVCSVDGLVSLKRRGRNCFNDLMLWNPSIRKFHDIPLLPEIEASPDTLFQEAEIGLGYDPLVKNYKYVKLVFVDDNDSDDTMRLHALAIYTLGADSWKIIRCSDFEWELDCTSVKAVYLRGSLYFLAIRRKRGALDLVSFDLSSEVFGSINLPDDIAYICDYPNFEGALSLVRYGCSSVAVLVTVDECSLWAWESESMCWTRPYSLELNVSHSQFLCLHKKCDILMALTVSSYASTRAHSSGQRCRMVSSYSLETGEEKILMMEKGKGDFKLCGVYGYIESLVPLK